jgi:hypothetical protein
MTATAGVTGNRRWRPSRRAWRIAELSTAAILLIGAFLLWGPIGLGNGPLGVEMAPTISGVDQHETQLAFLLPMYNSSHSVAVVDGVTLIGGTRFPAPRLLKLGVLSATCLGAWPVRSASGGFVILGCGGAYRGTLIGSGVPYIHPVSGGFPAAAEVAPPPPGSCWVMTEVVVRYHVGIRHYTATDPYALVVCAPDAANHVNGALDAAQNAGG